MTKENVKDLGKLCIVLISDFTISKCGDTFYEHIYSAFVGGGGERQVGKSLGEDAVLNQNWIL